MRTDDPLVEGQRIDPAPTVITLAPPPGLAPRWSTTSLAAVAAMALLIGVVLGAIATSVSRPAAQAAASTSPSASADDAADGTTGTTAGDFAFSDVQVLRDPLGDFEVRARVTNDGTDWEGVSLTATIFHEGSVVATADGSVSGWRAGETRTVEFVSLDAYRGWDDVAFQVDFRF